MQLTLLIKIFVLQKVEFVAHNLLIFRSSGLRSKICWVEQSIGFPRWMNGNPISTIHTWPTCLFLIPGVTGRLFESAVTDGLLW